MRLHRVNRDHEIIRKTSVAKEREMFRIPPPDAAVQSHRPEHEHETGDGKIDRQHRIPFHARTMRSTWPEERINPLRRRPQKAEPRLERRPEIRLVRRHFIEQQRKVNRHNPPNRRDLLERSSEQFEKRVPVVTQA